MARDSSNTRGRREFLRAAATAPALLALAAWPLAAGAQSPSRGSASGGPASGEAGGGEPSGGGGATLKIGMIGAGREGGSLGSLLGQGRPSR